MSPLKTVYPGMFWVMLLGTASYAQTIPPAAPVVPEKYEFKVPEGTEYARHPEYVTGAVGTYRAVTVPGEIIVVQDSKTLVSCTTKADDRKTIDKCKLTDGATIEQIVQAWMDAAAAEDRARWGQP